MLNMFESRTERAVVYVCTTIFVACMVHVVTTIW